MVEYEILFKPKEHRNGTYLIFNRIKSEVLAEFMTFQSAMIEFENLKQRQQKASFEKVWNEMQEAQGAV